MAVLSLARNSIRNTHLHFALSSIPKRSFPLLFSSICRKNHSFSPRSLPQTQSLPPVAKKVPFTISVHGWTWEDPYHWMSDVNDPDFTAYLLQENSYAEAFMADTHRLQQTLFSEMKSRKPSKISTPPERWGPWLYYQHLPEGKEYPILCRKLQTETKGLFGSTFNYVTGGVGMEEILLDWNAIAEEYGYVHVGTCRVSPDHNWLAYTLDITGDERFTLQIKDLCGGHLLQNLNVNGVGSLAWAEDSHSLFYTVSDENQRPYRVQRTKLESNFADHIPIFTESDSSFCVDITSTKDGRFITIYVINANRQQDQLQRFQKRVSGVQYFLEHHRGFFYVLTNAPLGEDKRLFTDGNYYLTRCKAEDTESANLQTVIVPSEDMSLSDMDIFNDHLVLFLNKNDSPAICSINMTDVNSENQRQIDDLNPWFFPLPSSACTVMPGSNHDFMSSVYRVVLSSPVMPDVIVDYDMSRNTFSIVDQEVVMSTNGGSCSMKSDRDIKYIDGQTDKDRDACASTVQGWWDFSAAYCCERKEVVSHDGIRVPLTIICSRKAHQNGKSPGLLHGYGAYGEVLDKGWCPDRLSLLDRGWVFAFADVRGGSGGDPSWHQSGSGLNKLNSILDFVACGKYLVDEGYVNEHQLGAVGYSAGCVLVGAAINMHPELFRAAILKVPFLDLCNTLLDPSLPLTVLDYEEFGNPQMKPQFDSIFNYSPYDNISDGVCYPAMLVTASFNDSRVGVWEPAKWVAKVREHTCSSCSQSVILKTNMSGGHFGEGGRFGRCEELSYEYAFLMKIMGFLHS